MGPLMSVPGTLGLTQVPGRCVDWVADGLAGYQKLNSPVLLPSGGVAVGCYRQRVAKPLCRNGLSRDSLLYEIVAHRVGAILGKFLVYLIGTHIVRVAANFNIKSRVSNQNACDFRKLLPRTRPQRVLSRVEQHIRHADDEPSCGIAGLQNRIQLL